MDQATNRAMGRDINQAISQVMDLDMNRDISPAMIAADATVLAEQSSVASLVASSATASEDVMTAAERPSLVRSSEASPAMRLRGMVAATTDATAIAIAMKAATMIDVMAAMTIGMMVDTITDMTDGMTIGMMATATDF